MKVKELIELLEGFDAEQEVRVRVTEDEYILDLAVNEVFEVRDYDTDGTYVVLFYGVENKEDG